MTPAVLALALAVVAPAPVAARAFQVADRGEAAPATAAQPAAPPERRGEAAQAGEHGAAAEAPHSGWFWALVAKLVNFGLLVGGLAYLLKRPFAVYLQNRISSIHRDLVEAEELRRQAEAQMAEIEAKLTALPGQLDALRKQGGEEIAAEEARLRAAADAERARLVEHARREIELQVRIAKQELMREAAELAVGVAAERIKKHLTPDTQLRLVDRYADQIKDVRGLHD